MSERDYRASETPEWQPYQIDGEVVTIEPKHCYAILQALYVYRKVQEKEGRPTFNVSDAISMFSWIHNKSVLMGRLLYDGKPPLVDAPPTTFAAPDYSVEVIDDIL